MNRLAHNTNVLKLAAERACPLYCSQLEYCTFNLNERLEIAGRID